MYAPADSGREGAGKERARPGQGGLSGYCCESRRYFSVTILRVAVKSSVSRR